jgi:hypothetical protein
LRTIATLALVLSLASPLAAAETEPITVSAQVICSDPELESEIRDALQTELGRLPGVQLLPFNQGAHQLYLSVVRVRNTESEDAIAYAVGWVVGSADVEADAYHISSFAVATFPSADLDDWLHHKVLHIDDEYFAPLREGALPAESTPPEATVEPAPAAPADDEAPLEDDPGDEPSVLP